MNARVKAIDDQLKRLEPNAGESACQRVGADQHDRSHGRVVEWLADPNRMTDHHISLQGLDFFPADYLVLESPKTGRNAICDLTAIEQGLNRRSATNHRGPGALS